MLDAADAIDTDELAGILQQCVKHGEAARIDHADYLRVLGIAGVQTAGEAWRALATMSQRKLASHREALDVILNEGTLSTRLQRSVGPNVNAASLLATYRRLCDCLAEGRMFHAGG
jgi:carboxylate-amine ligase